MDSYERKLVNLAVECFDKLHDLPPEDLSSVLRTLEALLAGDKLRKATAEREEKYPNLAARKSEGGVQ